MTHLKVSVACKSLFLILLFLNACKSESIKTSSTQEAISNKKEITPPNEPSPLPPSDNVNKEPVADNPSQFTTPSTSILPPQNLKVEKISPTEVKVSWTKAEVGYLVRAKNENTGVIVYYEDNITNDFVSIKNLSPDTLYYFWIHSKKNNFSFSDPSTYSSSASLKFKTDPAAKIEETKSTPTTSSPSSETPSSSPVTSHQYTAPKLDDNQCAKGSSKQITQYEITWYFDRYYPCGQFVNGDYWVVGPIVLSDISHKTGADNGDTLSNGSMLNLIPGQTQGLYRNGGPSFYENRPAYDASKNISLKLPLSIGANNSIFSVMNNPNTWSGGTAREYVWFKEVAVLTVLPQAAPEGSFRPPYAGNDKSLRWNFFQLNFSALKKHPIPNAINAPSLAWLEEATRRPLLEMDTHYLNSNWKASWSESKTGGYPRRTYGREVATISGAAALMLNTSISDSAKKRLAVHMVQWGIDTYGLLQNGMMFLGSGGHQNGRLIPLYLAGKLMNDSNILAKAKAGSPLQELLTHFFVTQKIVEFSQGFPVFCKSSLSQQDKAKDPTYGNVLYACSNEPYASRPSYNMDWVGVPEWTGTHAFDPLNTPTWAHPWERGYRDVNGGANSAAVAALLIMNARTEIGHEAFFRYYIERYYPAKKPQGNATFSGDSNGIQAFTRDMWENYVLK